MADIKKGEPERPATPPSQEEAEKNDKSDRYESTMPDVLYNDPNRPQLNIKDELNLSAARTYIHFCLMEGEGTQIEGSAPSPNDPPPPPHHGSLFPRPYMRPLEVQYPNIRLTCRELDNIHHAIRRANSRARAEGTEAKRDPSLKRLIDQIRNRLNVKA